MKLYVYADESGTFDKVHNDLFVYGGVVVPGSETKCEIERKYIAIERSIREASDKFGPHDELKACRLNMRQRKRLYDVIEGSGCQQFGVIINQRNLYDRVFATTGTKQRYLDWALKMGIKRGVLEAIQRAPFTKQDVDSIVVFVDEHSSSTAGKYNLSESIDEEFRVGMYNPEYGLQREPIFSPSFPKIPVRYHDSRSITLIRAADITANWIFCAERDRDSYPQAISDVERLATIYRHP
jgi:hypothetical protein